MTTDQERADLARLDGSGGAVAAWAPGRCTLVGEHLDYVGGTVLCCAVDLGVAVAVADAPDGRWRVRSGPRQATRRAALEMRGDIADRPLAAVAVLADNVAVAAPLRIAIAASLPEGSGLSSSAALISATLGALLRRSAQRLSVAEFTAAAWRAEHDLVGVPCGPLDHRAVVESEAGRVLDLDFGGAPAVMPVWPWDDIVLVVVNTAVTHDVADPRYARLRRAAEAVLQRSGRVSATELTASDVAALPPPLRSRAQHLFDESRRTEAAAEALSIGDASRLGAVMSAAHDGLRDLLGASVPAADAIVAAARDTRGCLGARLVGAGFGGSVVAMCRAADAAHAAAVMTAAAPGARWLWTGLPGPGLRQRSPDLFAVPLGSRAP